MVGFSVFRAVFNAKIIAIAPCFVYRKRAMRIPFNPAKYPYHFWRRALVHPACLALFFCAAAFNWLRVDVVAQQVIYAGQAYPFSWWSLSPIPIGFYALVLVIAAITWKKGRLFCGWACPHNILTESTRAFRGVLGIEPMPHGVQRLLNRMPLLVWPFKISVVLFGVLLCWGLSVLLLHYVVDWPLIIGDFNGLAAHPAALLGQGLLTLIGLFALCVGHIFCKTACPYGLAQSAMAFVQGKHPPMTIAYTGDDNKTACGTCTGCLQVCPVTIDPRAVDKGGEFKGCWNCGECIDACQTVKSHSDAEGLLRFTAPKVG